MAARRLCRFPSPSRTRLGPLIARVGAEASEFLRGSATALAQRRHPPPLDPVQASLTAHDAEVAALRSEGSTRALSTIEVERLFALCFALEQLGQNFADLARCVEEYAKGDGGGAGGGSRFAVENCIIVVGPAAVLDFPLNSLEIPLEWSWISLENPWNLL